MNIENKPTISVSEFKAWLTGLIRGKQGAVPDLDDWRQIKIMLEKTSEEFPTFPPVIPQVDEVEPETRRTYISDSTEDVIWNFSTNTKFTNCSFTPTEECGSAIQEMIDNNIWIDETLEYNER